MLSNTDAYKLKREWWDPLLVLGVGIFSFLFLSLWQYPLIHPSVWGDVAIAAEVYPPKEPFPGIYRIILWILFKLFPCGVVLDALQYMGRICIAGTGMVVYLVFRDILPSTLRIKAHMQRIGIMVGRLSAMMAALLFVCCDPVWRSGQTFSPTALTLAICCVGCYLYFRFLRNGEIKSLYASFAVFGILSAECAIGFVIGTVGAFALLIAVGWARDPDVPLINPLVDDLVREIVFKRLTYIYALFFLATLCANVIHFLYLGAQESTGIATVLDILFEYFRSAYMSTKTAASGVGWLFIFLMGIIPFVVALKLLPRAWDDDKFLPWVVGVVYVVIGVLAFSQLMGVRQLMFWTWLGPRRMMIHNDTLLAFTLLFDVAIVAFALAVIGVDAICRNYRRIAQQNFPESMLEELPAQMAEKLGTGRIWRKRIYWTLVFLIPVLTIPWRYLPTERKMARLIKENINEVLEETTGCEAIFTDGSFDELLELESIRRERPILCLSLMTPNNARSRMIRMRFAKDAEDKDLFESDSASALRTWVADKQERLTNCAVQIGFEMWKRCKLPYPPASGLVCLPGGVDAQERDRAINACIKLADDSYEIAKNNNPEKITDVFLRSRFPFVMWRLSRMMHIRSRIADAAHNRIAAIHEAARADELDSANYEFQRMRHDVNWLKLQNWGKLSPREGLVIGLSRADFALAGRFAEPVLAADPDDPRANFALGMKFLQEEQYSRAETFLRRCLIRRPDEPAVLNNLAILLTKLGRLDEAEEYIRKVIEKYPHIKESQSVLEKIMKLRGETNDVTNAQSPVAIPEKNTEVKK